MQKIIYNCDMCGKEVDEGGLNRYEIDAYYNPYLLNGGHPKRIDLCDECAEKWFKEVKIEGFNRNTQV